MLYLNRFFSVQLNLDFKLVEAILVLGVEAWAELCDLSSHELSDLVPCEVVAQVYRVGITWCLVRIIFLWLCFILHSRFFNRWLLLPFWLLFFLLDWALWLAFFLSSIFLDHWNFGCLIECWLLIHFLLTSWGYWRGIAIWFVCFLYDSISILINDLVSWFTHRGGVFIL